jgi:hypothetical protein
VQQDKPIIVQLVPARPTEEVTVGDVLLASVGLTGALILLSLVLAGLFAILLVRWHKRHPPEADHLPSVSPAIPLGSRAPDSTVRPSSPVP